MSVLALSACAGSATRVAPATVPTTAMPTTTVTVPAPTTTVETAESAYVAYVRKMGDTTSSATLVTFGNGVCEFARAGTLEKNLPVIASLQPALVPTYRAVLVAAGEKLCPDQAQALDAGMAALG